MPTRKYVAETLSLSHFFPKLGKPEPPIFVKMDIKKETFMEVFRIFKYVCVTLKFPSLLKALIMTFIYSLDFKYFFPIIKSLMLSSIYFLHVV